MNQYFLAASGDKRDRSAEIERIFREQGACVLGVGTFWVSGVKMPHGTSLFGMGHGTVIALSPEVEEGVAVELGSRCTLRSIAFSGSEEEMPRPEAIGTRHAIGFLGDATSTKDSHRQNRDSIVDGCFIDSFTGGGILCRDTGYSVPCSLCVSSCRIHNCGAGILIPHFSEYHKFTGVVATGNLYGCVNNGGNNVFSACAFDGNTEGFLIDNSSGTSKNNAHGSCVGCTFNHTNHNEGVGIRILGSAPGFVFSACQLFFSDIVVEGSGGVQFDHFNCGKHIKIFVKGGGGVRFSGCMFSTIPTFHVEDNDRVRVIDCTTKGGAPILYPAPVEEA
ncbi:MAG: hypothetical protein IKC69_07885 [Clostridia bacterium]|nr:hypothetical protein [Clostridia bacterium]